MCRLKIMQNLYCHTPPYDDFESHMDFSNAHHYINRGIWEVTDLELWFESDLEDGCVWVVKRVSEKGKYKFRKQLMEW